jgi:hypothetical protein
MGRGRAATGTAAGLLVEARLLTESGRERRPVARDHADAMWLLVRVCAVSGSTGALRRPRLLMEACLGA